MKIGFTIITNYYKEYDCYVVSCPKTGLRCISGNCDEAYAELTFLIEEWLDNTQKKISFTKQTYYSKKWLDRFCNDHELMLT